MRALPGDLPAVRHNAGDADTIVVGLDRVVDMSELERAWALPARAELVGGLLDGVTLICDDGGDAVVWHAPAPGLWQRMAGRYRTHDLGALLDTAKEAD